MSERRAALRGVYAVADTALLGTQVIGACESALQGGAALLQLRDKSADAETRLHLARRLQSLCSGYNVPLIINDDPELAGAVGAAGVHLGEHDASLDAARTELGREAIIGLSCYNDLTRARAAAAGGVDYIAFGSVFPSLSKPGARHAPLALFGQARAVLDRPLCAIGGITAANAEGVIAAGADMVAVINGIFGAPDIEAATRRLAALF